MSLQIRIMTYNVHSCIGMDGKASTERIAEVIFRSGADIVALQEVDAGLVRTGLADQDVSPCSRVYHGIGGRFHDVQHSPARWRPKSTWPSRYPVVRIDHMFITSNFAVEEVSVLRDAMTRNASDHLPLMSTVRLGGSANREPGR